MTSSGSVSVDSRGKLIGKSRIGFNCMFYSVSFLRINNRRSEQIIDHFAISIAHFTRGRRNHAELCAKKKLGTSFASIRPSDFSRRLDSPLPIDPSKAGRTHDFGSLCVLVRADRSMNVGICKRSNFDFGWKCRGLAS